MSTLDDWDSKSGITKKPSLMGSGLDARTANDPSSDSAEQSRLRGTSKTAKVVFRHGQTPSEQKKIRTRESSLMKEPNAPQIKARMGVAFSLPSVTDATKPYALCWNPDKTGGAGWEPVEITAC